MFEFLIKSKAHPIGLDIGHSMIKMIQLGHQDQAITVEVAEEESVDCNLEIGSEQWRQHIIDLIKTMYQRGAFRGEQVVSCLPGDILKIKSLRLDNDFAESIEETIQTEVAKRFGLDPNRDEIRYMTAGTAYQGDETKSEVIFFGIEQDQLINHINLLEQAGLCPVSLDTVPSSLFRCFQTTLRRREDQNIVSVFVDVGSRFTTVIIGRGQELAFVKQIPVAGHAFNEQVSNRLGISIDEAVELRHRMSQSSNEHVDIETRRAVLDAMSTSIEDLAHEISLCFRYYAVTFRGKRPDKAVFAGGEAYESALIEALRRHLGVTIDVAEPLRGFDLSNATFSRRRNPQMCEWAIAVGLALKGLELSNSVNKKKEVAIGA